MLNFQQHPHFTDTWRAQYGYSIQQFHYSGKWFPFYRGAKLTENGYSFELAQSACRNHFQQRMKDICPNPFGKQNVLETEIGTYTIYPQYRLWHGCFDGAEVASATTRQEVVRQLYGHYLSKTISA